MTSGAIVTILKGFWRPSRESVSVAVLRSSGVFDLVVAEFLEYLQPACLLSHGFQSLLQPLERRMVSSDRERASQ